ncbi:GNAT family N-acetyltransferase [Actinomadura rubrobrunea]|uniref:GNAT family N-acetyltransferase n=1 Tax=Actinomadura rubrobrunea TaxID=115335 RepID=A0A9W6PYI2_9ACTN|nr:bifunctional GNAT family N-acetyltransferase/acetate--CoA ligase family protein [Actinomadura rubrobrunea]GLW66730.1 GNAT family N-acetyltransferase [Actinomadura rubrobrunea]
MSAPITDAGEHALLRDGAMVHIRPLARSDRTALHALVDRLSEQSAYLRFFTAGTRTPHAYIDRVTGADWPGHALVAFQGGQAVGLAEMIPDKGGATAEIGILVDDRMHGRGLGTLLLEHLAADASARGITEFTATVLQENRAMLELLTTAGFQTRQRFAGREYEIRVPLEFTGELIAAIEARERTAGAASLGRVLRPWSVAVIGAGRDPRTVGHRILRNLLDGGYRGAVYPVNPHTDSILGVPAYPTVSEIPGGVCLAVVATPASSVLKVARHCAEQGVQALVVVSAGFAETGEEGARREAELLAICRESGMRLVGPNCLGVVNTAENLNASFLPAMPARGRLAVMSQSGAVGVALLEQAGATGLGVSSFVSVGNKADISGNDLLQYWEDDPTTSVIAMYLESFGNPRKFAALARRIGARKPIVVLKSGRSAAGGRAVRSHTAAAATSDIAVDALLRRAGVVRVETVRDMLDTARLLAHQPLPRGRRVAVVGNSGGPGVLAADACATHGLEVPELAEATRRALRETLGPAAAVANPVDLTADGGAERLAEALRTVLRDPGVDAVIAVYTPPFGSGAAASKAAIAAAARDADKPVLACVVGEDSLIDDGSVQVPAYAYPEQAVTALRHAVDQAEWRRRPAPPAAAPPGVRPEQVRGLVEAELRLAPEGRWLDPETARRLLGGYGIAVAETIGVDGPESAVEAAAATGYPVALKAVGPALVHKSDVGGVRLDLRTPEQVRDAYRAMAASLGEAMTGAVVQRMAGEGVEIIIGAVEDPRFGPLVMVGMGGTAADLLGDRVFRAAPLADGEAAEMIRSLRCAPLLFGYRGRPPAAVSALEDQVARVARLVADNPEIAELDLNPVIVTPRGAAAVDVRVRLAPPPPVPSPLGRALG